MENKSVLPLLGLLALGAGLIYLGSEAQATEEPEDESVPSTVDYEDEALKEALENTDE